MTPPRSSRWPERVAFLLLSISALAVLVEKVGASGGCICIASFVVAIVMCPIIASVFLWQVVADGMRKRLRITSLVGLLLTLMLAAWLFLF